MSANMKYKDYSLLFPIMENGMGPVWRGMIYSLAGLMEIWILMLFQHEVKGKIRWWHVLILGVFMLSMAIGPTIGAIVEFGPEEATKQRNSPYEQWKLVNIGKACAARRFFVHLSVAQWFLRKGRHIHVSHRGSAEFPQTEETIYRDFHHYRHHELHGDAMVAH